MIRGWYGPFCDTMNNSITFLLYCVWGKSSENDWNRCVVASGKGLEIKTGLLHVILRLFRLLCSQSLNRANGYALSLLCLRGFCCSLVLTLCSHSNRVEAVASCLYTEFETSFQSDCPHRATKGDYIGKMMFPFQCGDPMIKPISLITKIVETMLQSILFDKYSEFSKISTLTHWRVMIHMYIYVWTESSLVRVMVFRLLDA